MRLIGLLFIAASFISWAQAQDVVCSKKMRKVVVVNEGDSFSFSTQEGEAYAAKSKCQVVYKKDPSCPSIRFSCNQFDLNSKRVNCKGGDKITIVADGKSTKFCQDSAPDVTTSSNTLRVVFTSNKKKHAAGAVCTAECVSEETTTTSGEEPVTTTPTTGSTGSTSTAPTTGNSSCPRERPDFQSSCTGQEGLSCEYGTQTCCGETSPEMMMECHKEGEKGLWQGYFVDTICMLGGSCPPGPTKPTPPVSCICTEQYSPVCGVDGKTYSNTCYAACEGGGGVGVAVSCAGECPCKDCICPEVYSPVCGSDGQTYSNACKANCAGVEVAAQGECA